jgi:ABC-2 type transport system permease protein/sodium transport system permease protein
LAFEIHLFNDLLGIKAFTGEQFIVVQELLEAWRAVPLGMILFCLGIVPGIFEELFFRGFLFAALRTRLSPAKTVVASALLFGLFHVVSGSMLTPERFLPSMFLGLLLGSIVAITGSVFPAMVLHAIHNCLLLSLAYYQDDLVSDGWNLSWTGHLPAGWILAALVGLIVGFALIWLASRPKVGEPVTQAGRMV